MSSVFLPPTEPPLDLPERPQGAGPPRRGRGEDDGTGNRDWFPWSGPVALVAALAVAFVGGSIIAIGASLLGYPLGEGLPPGALLAGTAVQQVGFVVVAILFARMAHRPTSAAQFGLRPTRSGFWRAVGITFAVYVAYALFTGVWSTIVEIDAEDQLDDLGIEESDVALAFALVIVCVGAPIVEEFLFRGFVFPALRNWRGVWPAALITGALFGVIHVTGSPAGALVPLAVLGTGLCLVYQWTGSLYPCVALHAINNSIAFGVMQEWEAGTIALVAGSLAVCALLLVPVARRWGPALPAPGATGSGDGGPPPPPAVPVA